MSSGVCASAKTAALHRGMLNDNPSYRENRMTERHFLLDMPISEIMDRWPQTVPVFLKHQPQCVGCAMSVFDTIEDAVLVYNIPVEVVLGELKAVLGSDFLK